MKILVYGAGNIGSIYAALLEQSGQEVSILARGDRLARIRAHGIELENVVAEKKTTTHVQALERLDPDDAYDLVLVILPKNKVSEVLPVLSENRSTPSIMFMVNNAAGPGAMIDALGQERVLLGFPGAAGVLRDHVVRYLIMSAREQPTTIGELDGSHSARFRAIAATLKGAGFSVAISPNMDAWLKTHAAEIIPTAGAYYMTRCHLGRMAASRDVLALMIDGIREGYRVLNALNVPVTPSRHRLFRWLPRPFLISIMRKMLRSELAELKIGHAQAARSEMRLLAHECQLLARAAAIPTPALDKICSHIITEYGQKAV
jgi:2-dehydropantoate 2-reductase